MTNKMPKPAFQILLGMLIFSFAVISCNNDGEKKDTPADTAAKMDNMPTPPIDTAKVDTSLRKKPTDSGD